MISLAIIQKGQLTDCVLIPDLGRDQCKELQEEWDLGAPVVAVTVPVALLRLIFDKAEGEVTLYIGAESRVK